jgi:hypothetical protein
MMPRLYPVFLAAAALFVSAITLPVSAQDKKDSVAALFEGVPADLQTNVRANSVRRDRVNDWLIENVDGKGKVAELDMPVSVNAVRDADKTYRVYITKQSTAAEAAAMNVSVLGAKWPVLIRDGKGAGSSDDFGFTGVSAADAEALVELKHVHIQGKVKTARVLSGGIMLTLEDVLIDGKKLTPRKEGQIKGKGKQ